MPSGEIVDVGRTVVSHARITRETDQRYNRTRSRYAFVPASPTCLRDVDTREQERQVRAAHLHGPVWTIPGIKRAA